MEEMIDLNISRQSVCDKFKDFVREYATWRKQNGLGDTKITNVHEMLTGMTDKHGRICRQVKHKERKDQKEDWPEGATESIAGYLFYSILLMENYDMDIFCGMDKELYEAAKQHRKEV